ncbi:MULTISPECIES: Imm26 family immunity protein [unclassified Flavobacterium]|uniref:Imm26 family immunity protein n=1 Tax=unclassified Flavobacterium TaxID=196869 RepID=UPI001AC02F9E|nr:MULTISPECIES: Imm26 family immunity protein [unclassified Flavobacterium]MBN9284151.1 hypothetical protein [Flavobacterium sp.]
MKKQQITKGAILEINIENKYYTYAQILENAGYAFFDYRTEVPLKEFSVLENKKILFIVAVYNDVITQGRWLKVGKLNIREEIRKQPMKFIQDALNPENFELYDPNTGEITPTTKKHIKGLERAAVWEAHHVEDRIRDYYNGVPCVWLAEDIELFNSIE